MNARAEIVPSLVDRIKKTLVGLKMPRAIEILDVTLRRIEQGEMTAIEACQIASNPDPLSRPITPPQEGWSGLIHVVHRREVPVHPHG
jgi:hypothetical protein